MRSYRIKVSGLTACARLDGDVAAEPSRRVPAERRANAFAAAVFRFTECIGDVVYGGGVAIAHRNQHFGKDLSRHSCNFVVLAHDYDFCAAVYDPHGDGFLNPLSDFPVFAKELYRFFLAI